VRIEAYWRHFGGECGELWWWTAFVGVVKLVSWREWIVLVVPGLSEKLIKKRKKK